MATLRMIVPGVLSLHAGKDDSIILPSRCITQSKDPIPESTVLEWNGIIRFKNQGSEQIDPQ